MVNGKFTQIIKALLVCCVSDTLIALLDVQCRYGNYVLCDLGSLSWYLHSLGLLNLISPPG